MGKGIDTGTDRVDADPGSDQLRLAAMEQEVATLRRRLDDVEGRPGAGQHGAESSRPHYMADERPGRAGALNEAIAAAGSSIRRVFDHSPVSTSIVFFAVALIVFQLID